MQYDKNYGIIPDTQAQILSNYLSLFQNVFPNATSPDDPTYVIATVNSYFDEINQQALQVLWNSINSNTASGLGLDILANTTLNLFRKLLTPSACIVQIVVQNLLSYVDILIDITVAGSPATIPIGWQITGTVTPSPVYATLTSYTGLTTGVHTIRCYSTDTTTAIAIGDLDTPQAATGIVFVSATNQAAAVLGQLVIPADWPITASTLNPSPTYTPRRVYTYTANGTYNLLVYSDDILKNIDIGQLNTFVQINNNNPTPVGMIASVTNTVANILGKPAESDQQFAQRRRYYLNVQGQTYYGLENVILNLNIPALNSLFIEEVISSEDRNASIAIIKVTVTVPGSGSVNIPINWTVYSTGTPPSPAYKTQSTYTFTSSGDYYIPVFSTDITTAVAIGAFTTGDSISGVVVDGNLDPAILGITISLGQRGYRIYLDYPAAGSGGTFDTQDLYLQQIASAAFEYHPLGTQFYGDVTGSTLFTVNTPYSGYTANVYLSPLQIYETTIVLTIVYNVSPSDAGFSNGIFPYQYITDGSLKTRVLDLINSYFASKTLPKDLVYSITELSEIIQNAFDGIVALSSPTVPFTFGTVAGPTTDLLFLRRPIGYKFNLTDGNFTFAAVNKDTL